MIQSRCENYRNLLQQVIGINTSFPPQKRLAIGRQLSLTLMKLKVFVTHGFNDTITPYFASDMALAQIPAFGGDATRLTLTVYPGGHMFYSREGSRRAFRDDVRKLLE